MISNVYLRNHLILSTLFLTDIVVGGLTAHIVPEEVPEDRDEGVVELRHGETVLALQVVRLSLGPVKPLHGLVGVRPLPLPGVVLTVALLHVRQLSDMRRTFLSPGNMFLSSSPLLILYEIRGFLVRIYLL